MKGKERKKEAKKEKSDKKTKVLTDYQREKQSKSDRGMSIIPKEGYLKKITAQSLRMSGEQKFKEGDSLLFSRETTNRADLLVFTDQFQCYKSRLSEFEDGKASQLGDYLPQKLGMEQGESVISVVLTQDYSGFVLFFFENGKVAKVPLNAYETKTNRKKLTGAYCDKSPLVSVYALQADEQMAVYASDGRALIFSTAQLLPKTTRNTQGVTVMSLKRKAVMNAVLPLEQSGIENQSRYRTKTIPAAGALLKPEDMQEKQEKLDI